MKALKLSLPVLLACVIFALSSCAQYPVQKANELVPAGFLPQNIKTVDSVVNDFMAKYKVPGLSFAIAQNDSVKIQRCYGYADKDKGQLMSPGNRFRIASISKPFTSTAIMLLMQQG